MDLLKTPLPKGLEDEMRDAYRTLSKHHSEDADVAVRSSATAEDLPGASFAGQQETFLNIRGEDALLQACRRCFASLFTNRAISYRTEKGFDHFQVALSIAVQKMVRSDLAASGVLFTVDTETGFPDVVFINAAFGLGENIVQGVVWPAGASRSRGTTAGGRARRSAPRSERAGPGSSATRRTSPPSRTARSSSPR